VQGESLPPSSIALPIRIIDEGWMADAGDIEPLIARGALSEAASALRMALLGRPERLDLMNLLAHVFQISLRAGPTSISVDRTPRESGEGLFLQGAAAIAAGRLDAADRSFRAGLAVDPADYACRAALAVIVLIATQGDRIRVMLDDAGTVEVLRLENALRLTPIGRPIRGHALFAYYSETILLPAGHPSFAAHTNRWESRCIARLLIGLGYVVDAVELGGPLPSQVETYDVVFCLHDGLARMEGRLSPRARKIMLLTGSSPDYQNRRELERIAALALADHCLLQGNAFTRSTYAASLHAKTILIPVSGAVEARPPVPRSGPSASRHVLWHFGIGAIHKGLDLAVEAFLRNPGWTLEVVSQACDESDFLSIYGEAIRKACNVRLHGFQFPSSRQFREIAGRCVAFLGTSCSEGTSTACITGLQHGLVPILTRDCGVDLDSGFGATIEDDSIEAVERAVSQVLSLQAEELARQGRLARSRAESVYSRRAFTESVRSAFERILPPLREA
jgi:hypothetical protein